MEIPTPPCRLTHSLDIQSRFGDFDAFAHVNNNAYLQYYDLGKARFLSDLLGHICSPSELGAVIVNINCNFFAPSLMNEPLAVQTGCLKLGDRSFTLFQQIVNPQTGSVKGNATTVLAGFDIATQSSAPIPAALSAALRTLL